MDAPPFVPLADGRRFRVEPARQGPSAPRRVALRTCEFPAPSRGATPLAMETVFRTILIGAGATFVMDLWAALLRKLGVPSLDFAMLGRWILHLSRGRVMHDNIARATPIEGEILIGWAAHYSIGIGFAGLLLALFGLEWAYAPTPGPALLFGLVTVVAPLLVLQPALGAGIASRKTPTPLFNAFKSVVTHTVFGFGLYFAARVTSP